MNSKEKICKKGGEWVLDKFLDEFNALNRQQAIEKLMQCNTSERWCEKMEQARPFSDSAHLYQMADNIWKQSSEVDLLQAFDGHPEIGDISTLRKKYKNTAASAGHEQSGVKTANNETLAALAKGNQDYKKKFGFIFIVCASGKSADEMLALLLQRLPNNRQHELINAAKEQGKITQIRLQKLVQEEDSPKKDKK